MQISHQNYNYENEKQKLHVASDPTYKSNAHVSMMRVSIFLDKLCSFSKTQRNPKKRENCLGNLMTIKVQMMTGIMSLLRQELVNVFLE